MAKDKGTKKGKKKEEVEEQEGVQETKGAFQLRGIVSGTENSDRFYVEDEIKNGKNAGVATRRLNFGVQTSPHQKVFVQMFGMEPERVYVYDNEEKSGGFVSYDEWQKKEKKWAEEGKVTFDSTIALEWEDKEDEDDENEKLVAIKRHLPRYDAVDYITDELEDGMSVDVRGNISYNTYVNKSGETKTSIQYNIEKIFLLPYDIDFESDKFKEKALFTQPFISTGASIDEETSTALIFGKVVNYNKVASDATFEIHYEGNESFEKMAKYIEENFGFGTYAEAHGEIVNKVLVIEEAEDETSGMLGESNAMKTTSSYEQALAIRGIESYEIGKYGEDDFTSENDEFESGSEEKEDEKPDAFGESSQIDISDDDLPF